MSGSPELRQRTLTGLGWTVTSRLFQQVLQFVFTAVLARLVAPHDFGLIALMSVFTGFAALFVDFGLSAAIVQRAEIEDRHLDCAFWLNVAMGTALMLALMAAAPGLVAFYNEPRLLPITLAYAPAFLIVSLVGVQLSILERAMNFRKITVLENLAFVGANSLAVGLAVTGFGVWSLVSQMLAWGLFRVVLLWGTSSWRPRARFERDAFRDLWGFSSRMAGFGVVNYWARNADNLLIGRFVGTAPLAFYNRAYNLMLVPLDTISAVTTRVMLPALSRLQDDPERLKGVYLRSIRLISVVMYPAIVGLFVVSRQFILTIYGPRWAATIPLLHILCIASLAQTFGRTLSWVFSSLGRADWLFRWGMVSSVTAICSFFIGLPWGVRGVAISYTCWTYLATYTVLVLTERLVGLRVSEVMRAVGGALSASLVMAAAVWFVTAKVGAGWGVGEQLGAGVVTGIGSYVVALRLISPKPYGEAIELIREYVGLRRNRAAVGQGS